MNSWAISSGNGRPVLEMVNGRIEQFLEAAGAEPQSGALTHVAMPKEPTVGTDRVVLFLIPGGREHDSAAPFSRAAILTSRVGSGQGGNII
jgi:hypothetical protein